MVEPSGHRAFFWFRKVRGQPTWKTIGFFPDLSIENARARAAELNAAVAAWKATDFRGDHPLTPRRELTLGPFLKITLSGDSERTQKRDRAVQGARWQLNCYFAPWRERKLSAVRRSDVRSFMRKSGKRTGR